MITDDDTARVRIAALRAIAVVGEAEHAAAVATASTAPDPTIAGAAETAIRRLARRLDRDPRTLLDP